MSAVIEKQQKEPFHPTLSLAEVYSKYRITEEKDTQNPLLMDLVAEELAAFYAVSKQSVLIRMQEVGFTEAKAISQFESLNKPHHDIEEEDAFFVYSTNTELRRLMDEGLFVYVWSTIRHLLARANGV